MEIIFEIHLMMSALKPYFIGASIPIGVGSMLWIVGGMK
jgi:hypothetical protein